MAVWSALRAGTCLDVGLGIFKGCLEADPGCTACRETQPGLEAPQLQAMLQRGDSFMPAPVPTATRPATAGYLGATPLQSRPSTAAMNYEDPNL